MPALFAQRGIDPKGRILPFDAFQLFRDLDEDLDVRRIDPAAAAAIVARAEAYQKTPYPQLTASEYMRYAREGDRVGYETPCFERRSRLLTYLLAECVEQQGRFTDALIDGLWLILEETTWIIPAHNDHTRKGNPLNYMYRETVEYIDLFSAETGAALAWVYRLGRPILDQITPLLADRLLYELERRIVQPFLTKSMYWMGLQGEKVNNWNPWIVSSCLTVCALCVRDTSVREEMAARAMCMLDAFTGGYYEDGGCDEGPSYWGAAGAAYFDALELLYDMSGGEIDLFGEPFIRRMGEYIADFHIAGDYYVNFADGPARLHHDGIQIARYGRRTGSDKLRGFGAALVARDPEARLAQWATARGSSWHTYRQFKALWDRVEPTTPYQPPTQVFYDGLQVLIARQEPREDRGLFLAVKGGHNDESHNHNDVGQFIVYADGAPLLIDAGVGTYTRQTFSSDRYTIWTMQSSYHNLPDLNGQMQAPGSTYRAENVRYMPADDGAALTLSLAGAYPAQAGLAAYTRQVSLTAAGVTVRDAVAFQAQGRIVCHFMTCDEPDLREPGLARFPNGHTLAYAPGLSAQVETVPIDDPKLSGAWGRDVLFRLSLWPDAPLQEETLTFTIR